MIKSSKWAAVVAVALGSTVGAYATVFSNFVYSGTLSSGIGETSSGNSVSFTVPNAAVGDFLPSRFGGFTIQYDATGGADFGADVVGINTAGLGAIAGSGHVFFTETVFEIDAFGNEIGTPLGSISAILDEGDSTFNAVLKFGHSAKNIRAKKSFILSAPNTEAFDLAAVTLVNQHLTPVPEPASMAALGIGVVTLLRRRNRK